MFCVAIVGGIASGKSTVSEYLATQGFMIVSADEIAKNITSTNLEVKAAIKKYFGFADEIDRSKIRKIIFNDPKARSWLETLLHPIIRDEINNKLQEFKANNIHNVAVEIPLLSDKSDYPLIDTVLCVVAAPEVQSQRLQERWHIDHATALNIINLQPKRLQIEQLADDLINNNGSKHELLEQIKQLSYANCLKT